MALLRKISLVTLLFTIAGFSYSCDSTSIIRFGNGKKNIIQKFDDGHPCGKWSYFSLNQDLLKRERYKNGILVFTWIYNDEGRVAETIDKKGKHKKHKHCNCK